MHSSQWFSIRNKFLLVISSLLILCIVAYLALALHTFRRDKTELVFDLHRSLVSGISQQMQASLGSLSDKLEVFALVQESKDDQATAVIQGLLENDEQLIFLQSINRSSKGKDKRFIKRDYLETYSIRENYFEEVLADPSRIDSILRDGTSVWGVQPPSGPPLLAIGRAVLKEDRQGRPLAQYAVIGLIRLDSFYQARSFPGGWLMLTNSGMEVIAQVGEPSNESKLALLTRMQASGLPNEVLSFQNSAGRWMGSFEKSPNGLVAVLSAVDEKIAFAAMNDFIRRSLLFAGVLATMAFIAAILFSRSLTRPISVLVDGMSRVRQGKLDTQIVVHTHDETAMLASSFNLMIQELKDSRLQLEDINRELEGKVKERTAQLEEQNRAVKEAQEALLRTTRLASVGEIAARAAHEVLNPLTSMMTRLNLVHRRTESTMDADLQLLDDILMAWNKEYQEGGFERLVESWRSPSKINGSQSLFEEDLENLRTLKLSLSAKSRQMTEDTIFLLSESQRISKIVQSMRGLSHVRGSRELHHVHRLLNESAKIMADLCDQQGIELVLELNAKNDCVSLDRDEFVQGITNLIRNALQATKAMEIQGRILISSRQVGPSLQIDITDNGEGISKENQVRLFESQFSTKSKEEGTGLGLSIARRFIRSFGGDLVLAQSQLGKGSTFRLTLPVTQKQDVAA